MGRGGDGRGRGGWEGLGSGPSTNTAFDGFLRVCAALCAMCTLVGPMSSGGLTEGRPPGGGCGRGVTGVSSVRVVLARLPLEAGQPQHRGDVGSQGTARVHPSLDRKRMPSLPHLPNAGWSAGGRSKEMQLPFQKVRSLCRVRFGLHQLLVMRRPLAAWQKPGISCLLKPFPAP